MPIGTLDVLIVKEATFPSLIEKEAGLKLYVCGRDILKSDSFSEGLSPKVPTITVGLGPVPS